MGFISFPKLCLVLFFISLTCYYISAFRLIHTSQQTHEIKAKPEVKESVKKIDEIKEEIMSLKEKFKNQTMKLQHKSSENEDRVKTKIISEKKVKPVLTTLPDITKEKILRAKTMKPDTEEESSEEEKPVAQKEEPERRKIIKIPAPKPKEPLKIIKKQELDTEEESSEEETPIVLKEEPERRKIIKIPAPKPKETLKIIKSQEPDTEEEISEEETPVVQKEEPERRKIIKIPAPKPKESLKIIKKQEPDTKEKPLEEKKPVAPKEELEQKKIIKISAPKPKEPLKIIKKEEIIKVESSPVSKLKEQKIEIKKLLEEKKIEILKPKEEKKIESIKTKVEKKIEPIKQEEVKKVEINKLKEEKKKETIKPKEEKKDKKVEIKSKPKIDDKQVPPKQTKQTVKKEDIKPVKKEESKPVQKVFDSSITSLYFNLPSFSPNFDIVENEECKKQGHILIDQLNNHKIWALKMFDATAKIPSGILKGNLNQLGDYDQCVGIFTKIPLDDKDSEVKIAGKYCLADIDFVAETQEMKFPVHLAQSRAMIRSKSQDPGHFIPRFTTIRWGLCIPAACSAEDAESILKDSIKAYNESTNIGINFDVSIQADQCHVRKAPKNLFEHHYTTLGTLGLTAIIGILVLVATLRDIRLLEITENSEEVSTEKQESSKMEKMLMTFSLKRTVASLLQQDSDPDDIKCIHGIRTVCTFILYIAHKLIPMGHLPFTNKTTLTEISNYPFSIILRLSLIYTDSFLLLSGILTSYSMSKDMEVKGRIPWLNRFVARFIRLTPSLLVVLLYYAYVLDLLGEGPLWGTIVTSNVKLCRESWWRNIFYIQNLYPFQEMCATHTHQLALDMQLSLIAPILVWLLYRRPLLGVTITILLHTVSVILRYYATTNYRLSLVIYHGISISQLYRTANMLYASTIYRATPYLAGVGLGVLLRQIKPNFYMPKILLALGWLVAGYFASWALYTPSHLSSRTYKYDITEAAQFSALCSLAWALALSWLIFSCFADKQGFLNSFLSSRPMIVLSRISYTLYLTQFMVFFYNVGTVRTASEFKINSSLDLTELGIIIIISTFLTLLVDMPVQKIKSILLKSTPVSKESEILPEADNIANVADKAQKISDVVKRVTISETVEVLDENDEEFEEELNHKFRQLSTESEAYSEDTEELLDEDEEIIEHLEYKMQQFSIESEPLSEPLSEDIEEILDDEETVETLDHNIRQSSFESQPSIEDVEDIVDEEILENLEDLSHKSSVKSQHSQEVEERHEEDVPVVEKFIFRIRPSTVKIECSPEPENIEKSAEVIQKSEDDEELVRKLENNIRKNAPVPEPLTDDEE